MTMPPTGPKAKLAGSNMDIVAIGPRPGRTPTNVPTTQPTKQKVRIWGWKTTPKPKNRLWMTSMAMLPWIS